MKKSSYISNSSQRYPLAFIAAVASLLAATLILSLLPQGIREELIRKSQEGKRSFFIEEKLKKLTPNDLANTVFLLGDSTAENFESEFTGYLRSTSVVSLSRQAFTMIDYFCIVSRAARLKPRAIIVTINLAAFSPVYHDNPTYRFPDMISLCAPQDLRAYSDDLGRFYGIGRDEIARYAKVESNDNLYSLFIGLRACVKDWIKDNIEANILGRRTKEEESSGAKEPSTFLYLYKIDTALFPADHPYFKFAKAIYEICKTEGVAVYFYITPIDVQFMEGAGIYSEVEPSINYLKSKFADTFEGGGGVVYDLHDKLSSDDIVDTQGHLKTSGRYKVYKLLSDILISKHLMRAQ